MASTLILLASCRLGSKGKQAENVGPTLRRAMTILERSKAKDDPQFARALELMGFWQLLHGEFVEAEAKFTEALVIREKLPERDDRAIANVLDDLGALHTAQVDRIDIEAIRAEVAGKPKPESSVEQHGHLAEVYYTRALAIREKVLKPDDRNITESLFNLGQLAMIRGRPADGERYLDAGSLLRKRPVFEQARSRETFGSSLPVRRSSARITPRPNADWRKPRRFSNRSTEPRATT